VRALSGGTYTVAAYNTQSSETANVCNVTISSLRAFTEQRILNRTEVRYMNVTVYRNETRVRLEERVRVEERIKEETLLHLPADVSWGYVSGGLLVLGLALLFAARKGS